MPRYTSPLWHFLIKRAVQTLCSNTNKKAAMNLSMGKKYSRTPVSIKSFTSSSACCFFMAMLPLHHPQDYWRPHHIFSILFPARVMKKDRFRAISWNVHLRDPEQDIVTDRKKGQVGYDKLFHVRLLIDQLRTACQALYHRWRELSVDERMVTIKAKTGMMQSGV